MSFSLLPNPLGRLFNPKEVLVIFLSLSSILIFIPIFTYIYFAKDLASKKNIMNRNNTGIVLLDRHGKVFFKFHEAKYREDVSFKELPRDLVNAVLAAEDANFYRHNGFSIRSIIGALIADIRKRDFSYGGSTITQQLVKNSLLNAKKNILRKYQEVILANEIERRYKKNEILEMYLNSVYFGQGAFGIESAANTYFGIRAKDLSLAQSSMLVGILVAPSKLSPVSGDLKQAKIRQEYVLSEMVESRFITPAQKKFALEENLIFNESPQPFDYSAPHFALMVKDELANKYGEETITRSGFIIKTTLDLDWQKFAEQQVREQVKRLAVNSTSNGAVVVIDPKTGEIKALVGSIDWDNNEFGKVNIATSFRQPGSAFKPIVYAAAFEKRLITPATVLKDEPAVFKQGYGAKDYKPKNYDGKFRGKVLARRALANSLNVPSVEVISKVGIRETIEMATRLGVTGLNDFSNYGYSLVLGSAEVRLVDLSSVYAAFANKGFYLEPTSILEIKDKSNQTVYTYSPNPKKVLDPEYAFMVSSILSDNTARAEVFGNVLNINREAAVKTGTTENFRDAWTIGYTPSLVVGVWIGNNSGKEMDNVAGSLGAAPIWKNLMERFLANTPKEKFEPPDNIASVYVCRFNGLRLKESSPAGYLEYFVKGTEPTQNCILPKPRPSPPLPSPSN